MRLTPFFWPPGPDFIQEIPSASHRFFDPILAYVRATNARVTQNPWVGAVFTPRTKAKLSYRIAMVGELDPWRPGEKTLGPTYAYHAPPQSPLFIIAHYVMLRLPNSPLEIHVQWSPAQGDKEEMAVLNLHAVTSRQQLAMIPILLDCLHQLKVKRGRPTGPAITPAEFSRMKGDVESLREQGATWEEIAEQLNLDPKTLRKYRSE